jgi:hypothetical protein
MAREVYQGNSKLKEKFDYGALTWKKLLHTNCEHSYLKMG